MFDFLFTQVFAPLRAFDRFAPAARHCCAPANAPLTPTREAADARRGRASSNEPFDFAHPLKN
jgi:hypothetical protein